MRDDFDDGSVDGTVDDTADNELEQAVGKVRENRCCCGCQSLVKSRDGSWFRCARGMLQLDVVALLTSKSASGSMRYTDDLGRDWMHREIVAFDRDAHCPHRYQTSPEAQVGGDAETSEAIDTLMAQLRADGVERRQGRPAKRTDGGEPTRNQSRYAERQRIIQERCRVEGIPPYICGQCGRMSPGLTVEGKVRRACSSPKCLGRAMGKESVANGRGYKRIADDAVDAIRTEYSSGVGGYRLLARLHGVSPGSIRDLVKGATRRGGK